MGTMANWCNFGVIGDLSWPRKEVAIQYDGTEVIVMPSSAANCASLHIELSSNRLCWIDAMTKLNRLLSLASWEDDSASILLSGLSGTPTPMAVEAHRDGHLTSIADFWVHRTAPITDPAAKRAVAIYREALNLRRFHAHPYALLGFYKILEMPFGNNGGKKREEWMEKTIQAMLGVSGIPKPVQDYGGNFQNAFGKTAAEIQKSLYKECRLAIAHASTNPALDPDNVTSLRKLSLAIDLMRELARVLIRDKFGIPERAQN